MKNQYENFKKIIFSYFINNEFQLENPDWKAIYKLSSIHSLTGIVYEAVKSRNICNDSNIKNTFRQAYLLTAKKDIIQEYQLNEILKLFKANGMKVILFKGVILKTLYNNSHLRTMGDIDLIIEAHAQTRADKLLLENGYIFDEMASKSTVRNYYRNGVCFEIHTQLMGKNPFPNADYIGYFQNPFKNAALKKDNIFVLNNEYHLIYLFAHMAKHFKFGGCGVRMVIDIYLFAKKYTDTLDWIYIEKQLEILKLKDFSDNIFSLCNRWFGTKFKTVSTLDEKQLEIIEDYILAGGVFGFYGRNTDSIRISNETGGSSLFKRIVGISKMVFPSYDFLCERYVWAKGFPRFLLPIGWIKFWWFRLAENKEKSFKRIRRAMKGNPDGDEHLKLMHIIGLNK